MLGNITCNIPCYGLARNLGLSTRQISVVRYGIKPVTITSWRRACLLMLIGITRSAIMTANVPYGVL